MMLKKYFLLFLGLSLGATQLNAQDDYLGLEYKFEKGDEYQIHQKANQETYLTVNDVDQRTTNNKDVIILLTVDSVIADGSAKIKARYKKIILSSSQRDAEVYVDTDSKEEDTFNKLFRILINKDFDVVLSRHGKVKKVSGMDQIFDEIVNSLSEVKEKEKPTLKKFLKDQLGPEQVKLNLSSVIPFYPSYKVHAGDSWTNHIEAEGLYDGGIDNYWELTYGNKFAAKLENKGKFYSDISEVVDLGGGQEGRVNLKGDIIGNYVINPKTSWPTRSIVHSELNGTFTIFVYKNKRQKRKNKKQEMKVPVRIIKNANFEIKHL